MWTFEQIYHGALNSVPAARHTGVYKVFVPEGFEVSFRQITDAVADSKNVKDVDLLKKRWNMIQSSSEDSGKNILYIGTTTDMLKERVTCFAKYGYGKVKNHHGGYPIWQIADNKKLLVDIYPFVGDPEAEETRLLDEYIDTYGTEPIGNTAVGKNSKYKYVRKEDRYILRE